MPAVVVAGGFLVLPFTSFCKAKDYSHNAVSPAAVVALAWDPVNAVIRRS
jgi:hypothetical protein